jgi:phospholipase B1, membrane-associated
MSFQSLQGAFVNLQLIPTFCKRIGPLCPIGPIGWNPAVDQLNAAQSGALASNLHHEIVDYLVPQVKKRNIPNTAFKYLHLQIGSNDVCLFCEQSTSDSGPGSPNDFEKNIRKTLEAVRLEIREWGTRFRCKDH